MQSSTFIDTFWQGTLRCSATCSTRLKMIKIKMEQMKSHLSWLMTVPLVGNICWRPYTLGPPPLTVRRVFFTMKPSSHPLDDSNPLSGEIMLSILPIAHKYCMETIETFILNRLKQAATTAAYVDLMVASRIVGSEPLCHQALKGLIVSHPKPDLVQAMQIGVAPYHAVMTAALHASSTAMLAYHRAAEKANVELSTVKKQLATAKSQREQLKMHASRSFSPY